MKNQPKKKLTKPSRLWLLLRCAILATVIACAAVLFLHLLFPFPEEKVADFFNRHQGCEVLSSDGQALRIFPGPDGSLALPISLGDVSPWARMGVLAIEDSRFRHHWGVDVPAICRAVATNLLAGRRVSGASTITMQMCKQIEPRPRTFTTKCIEAFRALQAEARYDKDHILELYLNTVPFGGNLIGIEAAARRYFGKSAADLNLPEAALLAGLPQAPSRLRPDRHPEQARTRRDQVLDAMFVCGYISRTQWEQARAADVMIQPGLPPMVAPHAAEFLRSRFPHHSRLHSSINFALQQAATEELRNAVATLEDRNIHNGAIVILENQTSSLLALCGSPEFFDDEHAGMVNAALAPRSPGSTLKPFIYAAAFDAGLATPGTILWDIPLRLRDYLPDNFDSACRGPVRADSALAESLNLPALRLLQQLGVDQVAGQLRANGLSLPRPAGEYGLALALGGVEVSLFDLTNAYATFARRGRYAPVQVLAGCRAVDGVPLYSPETCQLLAEALADTSRLGAEALLENQSSSSPRLAWKTGTSNGLRDAWAIAFTPEITVGVWLGNADGASARDLVGIDVAAPLASRLLRRAAGGRPATWFPQEPGVFHRDVCAETGLVPGPNCPRLVADSALRGRSRNIPCAVHRQVAGPDGATTVQAVWPPEIAAWLQTRTGQPAQTTGLKILSPPNGERYRTANSASHIPLRASGAGTLHWFVDDTPVGRTRAGDTLWWAPVAGEHRILCSDDQGRHDSATIQIR